MKTTIGGDRLGSGNKQETSFRNYERSTHDLSYTWRSSMCAGTLVPFMKRLALPGDKWEINLNADVMTLPTTGPLFGSYKVQLDVFEVPIRLYNSKLHNNRLGIGMNMAQIKLPELEFRTRNLYVAGVTPVEFTDNSQVNASCILKYLGISGLGSYPALSTEPLFFRNFNAVPYLAYWEIYKQYYANKQEEYGKCIHTTTGNLGSGQTPTAAWVLDESSQFLGSILDPVQQTIDDGYKVFISFPTNAIEVDPKKVQITIGAANSFLSDVFTSFFWDDKNKVLEAYDVKTPPVGLVKVLKVPMAIKGQPNNFFSIASFPLANIDYMRDEILGKTTWDNVVITNTSLAPYCYPMEQIENEWHACTYAMEGLALKTYQSDLFNNFITSEWIEGPNGISALTAIDTSSGEFTIDALNIASKVYDMLNRIAVSGGTYDDWLEAVYTHERVKGAESPVYCGSLIKELAFEEIVSTAETTDPKTSNKLPLGTLAGRGRLTGKHKGGRIEITVNEPSYIIGICSLTPRVDYSQGNDWDVNLKTLDDLHKPALDGIGFQDLITEQLLWSDTIMNDDGSVTQHSLGKQPAWINYMTEVNKCYGSFAEPNNSMFMTLNRRYERYTTGGVSGRLKDPTTYIDPSKYNYIFAETALSAQNFWMQINCDITARRKMSAKIIPNL